MQLGSTPATAVATTRARGCHGPPPPSTALDRPMTSSAAAPSLIPLELAAVTVPSFLNAGFSCAARSRVVPARGYSSRANVVPSGRGTGTSSSVNTHALSAASARHWLSTAKASCSARVILYRWATTSAVSPNEIVHSFLRRGFVNRQPTVVSAVSGARRLHGSPDLRVT